MYGQITFHIAGVLDLRRLKQQDLYFPFGNRAMLSPPGNDDEVSLVKLDALVAEVHPEASPQHQEELVLAGMIVPNEFALKLNDLHMLAIQFPNNTRVPVVGKQSQLFTEVHLFHAVRIAGETAGKIFGAGSCAAFEAAATIIA
jgi:hypothetical protein